MTAVVVLRLPLDRDLSGFIALLQRLRVPHRVSEEGGEQVLWVPGQELAEQVRELYARHPQGDDAGDADQRRVGDEGEKRHGSFDRPQVFQAQRA